MSILWCSCIYIPLIIFGHHKQTNLPSANSSLDMLMPAQNGCICVHGVYLPFFEFLKQLYVTKYWCHWEVAPFDTYFDSPSATQDATKLSGFVSTSYPGHDGRPGVTQATATTAYLSEPMIFSIASTGVMPTHCMT